METKEKKITWYQILEDRFQNLMRKYDMPEDIENEIYNFVLDVSRTQYKSGNKSGIAWLLRKQSEEGRLNSRMAPVAVGA